MYSCDGQDHHTGTGTGTATRSSSKYQPCVVVGAAADRPVAAGSLRRYSSARSPVQAPSRITTADQKASAEQDARLLQEPRRPRRRQYSPSSSSSSSLASRRSSTTVVATDVANFRAMVQELTGFPPAAIFRPLPRRAHAHAHGSTMSAARGCGGATSGGGGGGGGGGGAALHGGQYSSEVTATSAAGSSSPVDVPTAVQQAGAPMQCPPAAAGMFDGLGDLGSPEFDGWADLSFE